MFTGLRQRVARTPEAVLRWLTASTVRSTAIFVILSFVPILLLTYYIVSTSIQNSKAEALRADLEVRDFSDVLLRTSLRSEIEGLTGVADETLLHRALRGSQQVPIDRILRRLLRRQPEFALVALYDAQGNLLAPAAQGPAAQTPAAALAPIVVAHADWFQIVTRSQQVYISPLRTTPLGSVLIMAVPVTADGAGAQGHPGGVLMAQLPIAVVQDWVRRVNTGGERFVYLVDSERHLIAGPAHGPIESEDVGSMLGVAPALSGQRGTVDFLTPIHLESQVVSYAPLPEAHFAVLVVRPVRIGIYFLRVFYDKLALIAMIVFLLAVAGGMLLRAAFRYYLRYMREVERGRNKTEALLSSIGDGVFAVDTELRIIEFNPAAAALSGRNPREVFGKPYPEVISLVDEASGQPALDLVPQAIQQRRNLRFARNLRLVRAGGGTVPVAVSAAPVLDEQGGVSGCVVVLSDVSQEREVDRMKTEFISLASHQLRTPMSGVKGALSLLLDEVLGPLRAEQRQYLGRAYDANERLIALVNDLLNVSRLEQGLLQLTWQPIDLARLLETVVAEMRARAAKYAQDLVLDLASERLEVEGDSVRLREVFTNLVDNAIKYTPERGQVRVRGFAENRTAVIEVSDTGVGIPADKFPALFQKFSRIQNPLTAREFGTGLGLYFVKSVVDLHHGRIDVTSQPDQGTTFAVRLPLLGAPERPAAELPAEAPAPRG